MQNQIHQLTTEMSRLVGGKHVAVVIGACMNILQSALRNIPDNQVKAALAQNLKHLGHNLEKEAKGSIIHDISRRQ